VTSGPKSNMRSGWNEISDAYQDRYQIGTSQVHYGPLCPTEEQLHLLGDVSGKKVIELGAGAGQNSIYLAKNGAICTAIDISDRQLEHGRSIAALETVAVDFVRHSFGDLSDFDENSFDLALSVYALQYCYDVGELSRVTNGVSRLLKPNADFVFSVDHPVRTRGSWDDNDQFVLDNYFDRSTKTWQYRFPEVGVAPELSCNYKTIADYIGAVISSGLRIEAVLEPEPVPVDHNTRFGVKSQYGTNSKEDPYSYEHLSRVPGTLIVKASKPGGMWPQ